MARGPTNMKEEKTSYPFRKHKRKHAYNVKES